MTPAVFRAALEARKASREAIEAAMRAFCADEGTMEVLREGSTPDRFSFAVVLQATQCADAALLAKAVEAAIRVTDRYGQDHVGTAYTEKARAAFLRVWTGEERT